MSFDPLDAVTPIDGRYREKLHVLSAFFSEHTLIKNRLIIETKYLQAFLEAIGRKDDAAKIAGLEKSFKDLSVAEASLIKNIEKDVGHDVVAAAKYLEIRLEEMGLGELRPFVHFGLTSEDVNNIAYGLAVRDFLHKELVPECVVLTKKLATLAETNESTPFLARTHGQPAVPTTFGSFVANYAYRIASLTAELKTLKPAAKLGGAVGDLSALKTTYPHVDWQAFAEKFIEDMGLEYFPASTQILPHEKVSKILQTTALLAAVCANFCRDIWMLGALGLVSFGKPEAHVHSSTMPQKRNPLLFENAEGCFDLASNMLSYMATRLISSRLHRDLSDSVIKRFYGTAYALVLLGVKNTSEALDQLTVNAEAMKKEVETNISAQTEALQLILRKHGIKNGYRLAAEAAEKGLDWLKQQISNPEIIHETIQPYIQAAQEKTRHLLQKIVAII